MAAFVGFATGYAVETAVSKPVGGSIVTFGAATGTVPKITTISPALRLPLAGTFVGSARGALTGVSATSFSVASAGWTAGALSQSAASYFVRIRSGAAEGTWWQISTSTPNTASTLTIINRGISPVGLGVAAGDTFEIVPADTLGSFFSGVAADGGGTAAAGADLVRIHDGTNWREYYYNTSVGQWREGTATFDRSNTIIRPDAGIVYIRKAASALTFKVAGNVSDARERIVAPASGVTVVGNVFPVARTLGSLAIQNSPGFVPFAGNLAAADKVLVFDGTNWRSFHYNTSAGQWREGTSTFNRSTYALPFGAPVSFERGSGATANAVLTFDPPYTL